MDDVALLEGQTVEVTPDRVDPATPTDTGQTVAQAIDLNDNGAIDDAEILNAIE